jgi:hypothetical protein
VNPFPRVIETERLIIRASDPVSGAERARFVLGAVLDDGRIDPDGRLSRTIRYVRRNAA